MNKNHIGSQMRVMVFDKRRVHAQCRRAKKAGISHHWRLPSESLRDAMALSLCTLRARRTPGSHHGILLRNNKKGYLAGSLFHCLAEREGFEPSERSRVHLISSQAHSASLAPLRTRRIGYAVLISRSTHTTATHPLI